MIPLGIFALLESGCREVWRKNGLLIAIEADDPSERARVLSRDGFRRYAYVGATGSRNRHQATGRVL